MDKFWKFLRQNPYNNKDITYNLWDELGVLNTVSEKHQKGLSILLERTAQAILLEPTFFDKIDEIIIFPILVRIVRLLDTTDIKLDQFMYYYLDIDKNELGKLCTQDDYELYLTLEITQKISDRMQENENWQGVDETLMNNLIKRNKSND